MQLLHLRIFPNCLPYLPVRLFPITDAEYMRDNGKFECRLKEDGTGVELYTKVIK